MSLSAPAQVLARLEEIEQDLATRQSAYEQAAGERARYVRDWDKRLAIHQKTAKGANAETRKATALVAAVEQDDLYERMTDAESRYEALRIVTKVMEQRATIGQSILKAQGRGA